MKCFDWNDKKNALLRESRGISFEDVIFSLSHGGLLDEIQHPNSQKYPHQKVLIVEIEDYAYLVPFLESEDRVFLKTIIPSRKMTKKYLRGGI